MSATLLSNVQEIMERSLFEVLRKELVDKGYLPDITSFPNTQQGFTDYNTAISNIVTIKGFAIELFNEGANTRKGIKKVPRIIINSGSFLPGSLGGDPQRYYLDKGQYYSAMITPPQTADFFVNIHLISGSVEQERILNAILALALQRRSYIPFYDGTSNTFFCRHMNFFNGDDMDTGIIEKIHAYQIPDCWDTNDREFATGIAKMTQIDLHPNVMSQIDGTWGVIVSPSIQVRYTPKGVSNGTSIVTGTLTS
jgi:hypothetical protein